MLPGDDGGDVVALYQPSTYRAESEVARRLREMIDAMPDTMATDLSAQIDELERVEGIAFLRSSVRPSKPPSPAA